MRITLVTPGFSASEKDWCIPCLLDFVRALAVEHEVTVMSLRYPGPRPSYQVHGARVVALGGGTVRGVLRIPFFLRARWRLERETIRSGCDILHALWADEPGVLAALVASRLRVPLLVSLLGGELARFSDIGYGGQLSEVNRRLVRFALARAHLVSSGSEFLDELALDYVPHRRRQVLPLGVDLDRFGPKGERARLSGRPALLRVGSLIPVKDPLTLVGALARLGSRLPEAHLHFVGDGELRQAIEERAQELGIASRVVLHGNVQHDLLPSFYRAADLSISCSRFESQAMVILEAGACGTATVGTAVGSLPELVGSDLLCTTDDESALASTIERGLEDSLHRGQEIISRVRGRYGLQGTTTDWLAAYREILEGFPRARRT